MLFRLKIFLFSLFLFLFIPNKVFASDNFITDYQTTYTLGADGTTHVSLDVSLTNKTSDYYASSYSVQLGFTDIQNVRVLDSEGVFIPEINKTDSGAKIILDFRKDALGLNAKQKFTLSFDTNQVAQNNGTTWEINVPGISQQNNFNSFNAIVNVPQSLGKPSYIKPNVGTLSGNSLLFTKEDLGNSGISIGYGNSQIYDFNLTYHLTNKNIFPVNYEIAIPPDTNYQKIYLEKIVPAPNNVVRDKDGNWIAQVNVPAAKKINVVVTGKAKVNLFPDQEFITNDQIKNYTNAKNYWQANDPNIVVLAKKLKTPQTIYNYVVDNLNYDFSRVSKNQTRLGASQVLINKDSAVCLEFTDLFIALSRAAGIPAREVNGFANTQNSKERPLSLIKDILHAWPEYYDFTKQKWIMVDPTWGNTTQGVDYFNMLDFDHFAFVIRGYSSTYPVPAGGYKDQSDEGEKDVSVTVSKVEPQEVDLVKIEPKISNNIVAGFIQTASVRLINNGNTLTLPQDLMVDSSFANSRFLVEGIPPFGYKDVNINFGNIFLLTNKKDIIKIQFGKSLLEKKVSITPFFFDKFFIIGGLIIVITITTLSITAYRSRRISIPRR